MRLTGIVVGLLVLVGVFQSRALAAMRPTWANKATAFPAQCADRKVSSSCKPVTIEAPDGQHKVVVNYRPERVDDEPILRAVLSVTSPERGARQMEVPDGFQRIDLLWSPDSKAFFINGGNGGAYWGMWVYAVLADAKELKPIDITVNAKRDMVQQFPPCKSRNITFDCRKAIAEPDYNMTGIDWVRGSSTLVVMAEVPCSSSWGGIMCQVIGYELAVPTGDIVKRIPAKHLKRDWQRSMAFRFRVPDPPEYER